MSIGNLRVIVLTVLVTGFAGVPGWANGGRAEEVTVSQARSSVPAIASESDAVTAPAPEAEIRAPEPEASVYRCEGGGRTIYQSGPCERTQRQRDLSGGTLNVMSAPQGGRRISGAPALDERSDERRSGASFGEIRAPGFALVDAQRCDWLQRAIDRIDARARSANSARAMERLRIARRARIDETNVLKCETWPSRRD
jgi:hypothetical protein